MGDEFSKTIEVFRRRTEMELKRMQQQSENQRRREEVRRRKLATIGLRTQLRVVR